MVQTGPQAQRYLAGVWIVLAVLTPLIGFLGPRGFAPALGLMGLSCLGYFRPRNWEWAGLGLLALLVLWAGVSLTWSPAPNLAVHGAKDLGRLTVLHLGVQTVLSGAFVIAAAHLRAATARIALNAVSWGMFCLGVILVIEGVTQAGVYQWIQTLTGKPVRPDLAVRNVAVGGYVLAALYWPAAVALWIEGRRRLVLFLAAAVVFSTFMLRGDSPTLAMVASALVFWAVLKGGRAAVVSLLAVVTLYWLATPLLTLLLQSVGVLNRLHGHLPPSWDRRLEIWTFVTDTWLKHPVRGLGLDASRAFKGIIPLHPHDGGLQIWFELGAPGALLAAGFWVLLLWRLSCAPEDRLFAAAACACACVYLVIGAVSFSLWQEWWICMGAFALAACLALRQILAAGSEADARP
jgi:O-antigen ligase